MSVVVVPLALEIIGVAVSACAAAYAAYRVTTEPSLESRLKALVRNPDVGRTILQKIGHGSGKEDEMREVDRVFDEVVETLIGKATSADLKRAITRVAERQNLAGRRAFINQVRSWAGQYAA